MRLGLGNSIVQADCILQLKERGYSNIDALDGSVGMLEQAKEKGMYKNCILALLGPHPIEGIEKGNAKRNVPLK